MFTNFQDLTLFVAMCANTFMFTSEPQTSDHFQDPIPGHSTQETRNFSKPSPEKLNVQKLVKLSLLSRKLDPQSLSLSSLISDTDKITHDFLTSFLTTKRFN